MRAFMPVSWGAALLVVLAAGIWRSRFYATFAAILLTIHNLISCSVVPVLVARVESLWAPLGPIGAVLAWALQLGVYLHFASLIRSRIKGDLEKALITIPSQIYAAGTFVAFPAAIAIGLGFSPPLLWLPYLLGLLGGLQSVRTRFEQVDLRLDGEPVSALRRWPAGILARTRTKAPPAEGAEEVRPLRITQITDPHIGPFMSVARLRGIAERAVAADPDLVLLTGDFLTMESQDDPKHLIEALSPLRALPGRVFACRGNHDLEAGARALVPVAMEAIGARLLIDEEAFVETPAGPVQILGLDFYFRGRRERYEEACAAYPRREGALRLVLLHDPGAFRDLPEGEGDLVLSGHTHGGQVGLLTFGLPTTAVSVLSSVPDHGLWARGRDRLYVHRGTGHYGFPIRLGVPPEESLIRVFGLPS